MFDVAARTGEEISTDPLLSLRERLVVAPASGRFTPLPPQVFSTEGEWVEVDQILGEIDSGTGQEPVRSAFRGWLMGMLAIAGQPVRQGDALFWVYHP